MKALTPGFPLSRELPFSMNTDPGDLSESSLQFIPENEGLGVTHKMEF